jgi:chemotaxis protein methyltransferase WspC
MMLLDRIAGLMKRSCGLDVSSLGANALERVVSQRMQACQVPDQEAYWQRLSSSADELQELTEALVVPETWFFRDPEAFRALSSFAGDTSRRPLRLLSLPCSTGEEPYSMAMALFDAGWSGNDFVIDGVDISRQALAAARQAEYGRNAFRGADLRYRDRYFHPLASNRYRLDDRVRHAVQWHHANLFSSDLQRRLGQRDVIFCRNLLIYFDRPMQEQALELLTHMLTREGLLFVGPSEAALLLSRGYEWLNTPRAFGFRGAPARGAPPTVAPPSVRGKVPRPPAPREPVKAIPSPPARPRQPLPAGAARDATDTLRAAMALANEGKIAEAERLCQAELDAHPSSAEARYLLGLLRDARGDAHGAAELYRSALYLDPEHEQALSHLALLRERQGDVKGAELLHARARRVHVSSRRSR